MSKVDVSEFKGPLGELMDQCSPENGGRERFDEFNLWLKKVSIRLLVLLRTVRISAQSAITTSEEYFAEAGVKFMGDNFKSQFLGLKVVSTEAAELNVNKLTIASRDIPILAELDDKAEISVSQFRAFLAENRKSSEWFIFYLRGKDDNLWAVYAFWRSIYRGWRVFAYSVTNRGRWRDGGQVVSQV